MMEPMPRKKKWACTTHSCGAANHGFRRLSAGAPKRRHPPKTRNPMHKQVQMRTTTHENYRTNPKNGGECEAKPSASAQPRPPGPRPPATRGRGPRYSIKHASQPDSALPGHGHLAGRRPGPPKDPKNGAEGKR